MCDNSTVKEMNEDSEVQEIHDNSIAIDYTKGIILLSKKTDLEVKKI